jgi:3,4-dihydroxy 2-butanone 4-phosphate synthase/GTP cyclohydrolase II
MYRSEVIPKLAPVKEAVEVIAAGGMVVVIDDPGRENEGDLVMAAEFATPEAINFMATHGRGLICTPLLRERLEELEIPPMVERNTDHNGTAFHVSVDLAARTTTGISAGDRARTIAALTDPGSQPEDFTRPGHVFPLAYAPGGVLARAGHTEASIDLAVLAGLQPAAVICEIAREDGEMMRLPELAEFSNRHGLLITTIADLRRHLLSLGSVQRAAEARMPLDAAEFKAICYRDDQDGREHVAIMLGSVRNKKEVIVRLHSECLTGDALGSRRCDCGEQLQLALSLIAEAGSGVVVYLRGHEGRGIGLVEKMKAYGLQDSGLDTVEANVALGHPVDARDYTVGAEILADLGISEVRLLTNNPDKRSALQQRGISVRECVPLVTTPTTENIRYLSTKRTKMGHILPFDSVGGAAEISL